jgi:prepilin-type N-terminal cleavage/methylation domain-containing protein
VIRDEGGFTLVELVIVMAILTVVLGAVVALFTSGIKADADQNARFRAQQDLRLAMDKLRSDVHSSCAISTPATYNSWLTSVTLYKPADSCAAGANSVSWCTTASGTTYNLYRIVSSSCTGATAKVAAGLTSANVFLYFPPNSHLSGALASGTAGVTTQDASSNLPKLHVAFTIKQQGETNSYSLTDDFVLKNGPRSCGAGVAAC